MFSQNIISLYSEGNCHLLSYYMQKKLLNSEIYVLLNNNEIIHSLVYYNGDYYDIYGKYNSQKQCMKYYL